jgi:hypothetical protein
MTRQPTCVVASPGPSPHTGGSGRLRDLARALSDLCLGVVLGCLGHLIPRCLFMDISLESRGPRTPGLSFTLCVSAGTEPRRQVRRWSVGHGALCGGGVVASLDPPAREPRRVGALDDPLTRTVGTSTDREPVRDGSQSRDDAARTRPQLHAGDRIRRVASMVQRFRIIWSSTPTSSPRCGNSACTENGQHKRPKV